VSKPPEPIDIPDAGLNAGKFQLNPAADAARRLVRRRSRVCTAAVAAVIALALSLLKAWHR
jgi:hypothetical protein